MSVSGVFMLGHLGILIEELGHRQENQVQECIRGFNKAGKLVADLKPDIIVLSTPHSVRYSDYFHISPGEKAVGVMKGEGGRSVRLDAVYDQEFIKALVENANGEGIEAGTDWEYNSELDHGTIIPLKFVNDYYPGSQYKLVRICLSGLPFEDHYKLGTAIAKTSGQLGRNVVFIGSGDLSHKHESEGIYGFSEKAAEFDGKITQAMKDADFIKFMDYDLDYLEDAAECGLRSFIMAAGVLDRQDVAAEFLGYNKTYVGCAAASFLPQKANAARDILKEYGKIKKADTRVIPLGTDPLLYLVNLLMNQAAPKMPRFLPRRMMGEKAGVFLSFLDENGAVAYSLGNILPQKKNIAEDIFCCVQEAKVKICLANMGYAVDVVQAWEDIAEQSQMDCRQYGIWVEAGSRKGYGLPGFFDSNSAQLEHALETGGIRQDENWIMRRFTVSRRQAK